MSAPDPELIDWGRLIPWMRAQGLDVCDPEEVSLLTGGTQNILIAFTMHGRRFILRRPSRFPSEQSNKAMLREARVLGALASTPVPHARLLAACGDETVIGANFFIMDYVEGLNLTLGLPPLFQEAEVQRRVGFGLVDGLLDLEAIDPGDIGLADFGRTEGFLERQVQRWARQLESYSEYKGWDFDKALPGIDKVGRWLSAHLPAGFTPGLMHGDYHLGNVLADPAGAGLSAIVDWELSALGDPLLDLGWLLCTWPDAQGHGGVFDLQPWTGFPTRDEIVAYYAERATRHVGDVTWYEVMACYKLGIINEGTTARAAAGLADPATGDRLHGLARGLLHRALTRIEAA